MNNKFTKFFKRMDILMSLLFLTLKDPGSIAALFSMIKRSSKPLVKQRQLHILIGAFL